jgi:predicted DNA-binding transcriptional regulator YafY
VHLSYEDREGASTQRTVRPLGLFFWGNAWSLGAWCEMRDGFRNFRLDRMGEARVLGEGFVPEAGKTLEDLFRHYENE